VEEKNGPVGWSQDTSNTRAFRKLSSPFWIHRQLDAWPWCNLAASQRRPYCTSVNSHPPVGLVSRQWDAFDWASVLCDRHIHNDRASRSASSQQCAYTLYSSRAGFFGKASHHPSLSATLQPRFCSLRLLAFPKTKIPVEREEICECDGHTVHKLSQRRLTANWLAPQASDCSRMHSKVSSDWLPSYIKSTPTIIEIFKMAEFFPRSPCTHEFQPPFRQSSTRNLNTVSISTVVLFYGFSLYDRDLCLAYSFGWAPNS